MTMFGLDQTAVVYTAASGDGDYTVVDRASLTCRLAHIQTGAADVDGERARVGSARRLMWEAAYDMPDDAQVLIDGERWNVQAGTYSKLRGPDSSVIYRRCEVVKAV